MTTIDCNTCRKILPDLLFEPELDQSAAREHMKQCVACRTELAELRAAMGMLDAWKAPEPSAYFDARVRARLREAQRESPEGLWERWMDTLRFSTGRGLRPALAGGFVFLLLLGGGTAATVWSGPGSAPVVSSPTVNELRVFDNNAQALQQMDLLDEPGPENTPPQS